MRRASSGLTGYNGPNPFREGQARSFNDSKLIREFFPTSTFLSLFNEQHEILLGTRGSGKTVLLKMLSYSRLKELKHEQVQRFVQDKSFIGFYVPLHVEFMAALAGKSFPDEERMEFFQFAFNCSAADAFLSEVSCLIADCYHDPKDRLLTETKIVEKLVEIWFPHQNGIETIQELRWQISLLYQHEPFWADGSRTPLSLFAAPILIPILSVLAMVATMLGLDAERINWIACIDEAEWLKEPFIKCINTFLRSEKHPLVVKMATLPSKHSTRETVVPGLLVEPNGNDFNYRVVDMDWNSNDFEMFTNHLCSVRLERSGITTAGLEDFLGREGNDKGLDYFKLEVGEVESTDHKILDAIIPLLSEARQQRFERIKVDTSKARNEYLLKFSPVYYVRRMRQLDRQANRKVGWFAGAKAYRRVADGNPRRFIQLMNDTVEIAKQRILTPKHQHEIISDFCARELTAAEGLPGHGRVLKALLDDIGRLLYERIHGMPMVDGGCGFTIGQEVCEIPLIKSAVALALDYCHIVADNKEQHDVTPITIYRLSFIHAVNFWLPMRTGMTVMLKTNSLTANIQQELPKSVDNLTQRQSKEYVNQLQLSLFEGNNE